MTKIDPIQKAHDKARAFAGALREAIAVKELALQAMEDARAAAEVYLDAAPASISIETDQIHRAQTLLTVLDQTYPDPYGKINEAAAAAKFAANGNEAETVEP